MNISKVITLAIGLTFLLAAVASAQPETKTLDPDLGSPEAKTEDVAWLEGHWSGEALGGIAEEIWSPAKAHTMMGVFRFIDGDSIGFYEIFIISEENGSLVLRLKHFNADLTGWEEKDEMVTFPLVELGPEVAYFDGLTYRRVAENKLQVFVKMKSGEGATEELGFHYEMVEK